MSWWCKEPAHHGIGLVILVYTGFGASLFLVRTAYQSEYWELWSITCPYLMSGQIGARPSATNIRTRTRYHRGTFITLRINDIALRSLNEQAIERERSETPCLLLLSTGSSSHDGNTLYLFRRDCDTAHVTPADTRCNNNVIITSRRHHCDVIMMLLLRRVSTGMPWNVYPVILGLHISFKPNNVYFVES